MSWCKMEHKRENEAYVILHRGDRSRGYKRRERARARARARESPVVNMSVSPRAPASTSTWTSLRKALDIPFYRCKEMSSCTTGCSYVLRGWRGSALSPVHELTWPSEKCLEPCRSTAVGRHGSCWRLLASVGGLRATDVMGAHGEPSLPVARVTLDGTPVLFLHSLRQLARSRVMMYPL
jgi:hypothetical protein